MTKNRAGRDEWLGFASGHSVPTYERERLSLARAIDGGRHAGVGRYVREAVERAWTTRFGIVVSLELADIDTAADTFPSLSLRPRDGRSFTGFQTAAEAAKGEEYLELRRRVWLSHNDPSGLFVADDTDGTPLFAAWLSPATAPADVERWTGETWIEAVYTFPGARRRGVMRAGVAELLRIADGHGATRASAIISNHNIASLRGFAALGFVPREVQAEIWRGWRRRLEARPLDATALEAWRAAVGLPPA